MTASQYIIAFEVFEDCFMTCRLYCTIKEGDIDCFFFKESQVHTLSITGQ